MFSILNDNSSKLKGFMRISSTPSFKNFTLTDDCSLLVKINVGMCSVLEHFLSILQNLLHLHLPNLNLR